MKKVQAVIFDLYDTLVYLPNKETPYSELFSFLGLNSTEDIDRASRIAQTEDFSNLNFFVQRIYPGLKVDISRFEQEIEAHQASVVMYPEVEVVLEKLRKQGYILGLLSNVASPYKKPFFQLGLDAYFDYTIFSCDVGYMKPEKTIYQIMVDRIQKPTGNICMVGDSVKSDVQGPKQIGIKGLHLDRQGNSERSLTALNDIFRYI